MSVMEQVFAEGCTPACWTPVKCKVCGRPFIPAGRSVPLEATSSYCDPYEPCDPAQKRDASRQHLWDEHDSNRSYTDEPGWAAHVSGCARCGGRDDDEETSAGLLTDLETDLADEDGPEQTFPLSKAQFAKGCGFIFNGVDLCEDESGRWIYAYGARGKTVMARAVAAYDRDMTGMPFGGRPGPYVPDDIEHPWAVCVQDPEGPEGWFLKWSGVDADAPNAFQMTVIAR